MKSLMNMIETFNLSITTLNKSFLEEQSLYLLFTYLDQLGWLIASGEYSDGKDFKRWVDTYCDLSNMRFTSVDLWNTRCSFLHMGTAEHKHFDNSKHFRLAFYQNTDLTENEIIAQEVKYPRPTKIVDVASFYNCINNGINKFLDALEQDPELRLKVLEKSNKRNVLERPV
ncbi:hypothetical protein CDG68_12475 [Acinetobacter wuhouensis]|uniref:Uncharacterized protein n=2 Tax=Acinetobacter wuhouensis TaxID=1879050 RepID=A0A3G2T359_9GAMM|nr:hypothetical protein CDG68_12475 [Acinetobacter wuhouensis]